MARFVPAQVPEVVQPFWAALQRGEFIADAAAQVGTYRKQSTRWVAACGGVRPCRGRSLKGRCLTFADREEIALAHARGDKQCEIARRLGRSPSTISRELRRNADLCWRLPRHDRARPGVRTRETPETGQARDEPAAAGDRAGRSQAALIAGANRRAAASLVPDDLEMWVSTETIYWTTTGAR